MVTKIERWLWFVFLATAAWQTRLILWQADKNFIEWRSGALYATDVLLIALVVLAVVRGRGWYVRRMDVFDWTLGFVAAAAVLSLAHADQLTVGFIALARLLEFMLFYLYLRHYALRDFNADESALAFVVGALLQAGLAIGQYVAQHDLSLRWIGETLLRTDMRGVAVFYDMAHVKILRAYGTMPHPNVLAAYLIVALWVFARLWIRHKHDNRAVWGAGATLLLVALYSTWSRTMIAAWWLTAAIVVVATWWTRISSKWANIAIIRTRLRQAIILTAIVTVAFIGFQWHRAVARMTISVADESVRLRLLYAQDAVQSGGGLRLHVNWIGVGIGNFTTWLSLYDPSMPQFLYQPAHNFFLLVYSEIGLFGVALYSIWMILLIRAGWQSHRDQPFVRFGILAMLGGLLIMALFDHFFWTLQQGRLVFWGVLALAAGLSHSPPRPSLPRSGSPA